MKENAVLSNVRRWFGRAAKVAAAVAALTFALPAVADPSSWTSYETIDGIKWVYEFLEDHVAIVAEGEAAVDPKPTGTVKIPSKLGGTKPLYAVWKLAD